MANATFSSRISRVVSYIELTRPYNAVVFITTFSLGYFWASSNKLHLDFFTGIIILLLWHSLATVQNDLEDIAIDRANKRTGALLDSSISQRNAKHFMWFMGLSAFAVAAVSPARKTHFIILSILTLVAWAYNRPPLLLSRRPISSVLIMAFCYGLAPLIYGYTLSNHRPSNYMFLLFGFWFILRISTVILKDYKDSVGDRKFNKQTFYLRYGARATALMSVATAFIGYLGIVVLLWLIKSQGDKAAILVLLVTLMGIRNVIYRRGLLATTDEKKLHRIFKNSLGKQSQFEIGVLVCLLVF